MIDLLNKIIGVLPVGSAALPVGLVLDMVLRLIPSQKPRGVLHFLGDLVNKLGELFSKLGELSDKVLPQKLSVKL